jgi:hypothetical protein
VDIKWPCPPSHRSSKSEAVKVSQTCVDEHEELHPLLRNGGALLDTLREQSATAQSIVTVSCYAIFLSTDRQSQGLDANTESFRVLSRAISHPLFVLVDRRKLTGPSGIDFPHLIEGSRLRVW